MTHNTLQICHGSALVLKLTIDDTLYILAASITPSIPDCFSDNLDICYDNLTQLTGLNSFFFKLTTDQCFMMCLENGVKVQGKMEGSLDEVSLVGAGVGKWGNELNIVSSIHSPDGSVSESFSNARVNLPTLRTVATFSTASVVETASTEYTAPGKFEVKEGTVLFAEFVIEGVSQLFTASLTPSVSYISSNNMTIYYTDKNQLRAKKSFLITLKKDSIKIEFTNGVRMEGPLNQPGSADTGFMGGSGSFGMVEGKVAKRDHLVALSGDGAWYIR